jgi:hypothetical protein
VIAPIDGWLLIAGGELCVSADGVAPSCMPAGDEDATRFAELAYPEISGAHEAIEKAAARSRNVVLRETWPLEVHAGDGPRWLVAPRLAPGDRGSFRIESVDGLTHVGATPSSCVRIDGSAGLRGSITLVAGDEVDSLPRAYFPNLVEVRESERALLPLLAVACPE